MIGMKRLIVPLVFLAFAGIVVYSTMKLKVISCFVCVECFIWFAYVALFVVACVACSESSSSETQAKYPDLTGIEAIQIVKAHLVEKEFTYIPPSKPSECKDDTSGECTEEPVRVVGYCRALVESGGIWSVVHLAEYSLWRVRVARSEPFWGDTVLYWDLYQHTGYVNPASTQIKC